MRKKGLASSEEGDQIERFAPLMDAKIKPEMKQRDYAKAEDVHVRKEECVGSIGQWNHYAEAKDVVRCSRFGGTIK